MRLCVYVLLFIAVNIDVGSCARSYVAKSQTRQTRQTSTVIRTQSQSNFMETLAESLSKWFWLFGIIITVFGATLTVVGLMMQKMSHKHDEEVKPYWMQRRWLAGICVWLLGNVVCWLALGLTNQCLLACINCWNIVVVFVLSPMLFGEVISGKLVASAVLLVCGCIWVIVAGPKDYQAQTIDSINEAWRNPHFLGISATAFIFVVLTLGTAVFRYNQERATPLLTSIEYSVISAVFAWYAVLFSKTTSALLLTSVQSGENQVQLVGYSTFVLGMLFCGVCQIHCLNMGLKFGDAFVVLPIFEAISMTGQVVVDGIFFGEFHKFKLQDHVSLWFGVLSVMAGIALVIRCCHDERASKWGPFLLSDRDEQETLPLNTTANIIPSALVTAKGKSSLDILRSADKHPEKSDNL